MASLESLGSTLAAGGVGLGWAPLLQQNAWYASPSGPVGTASLGNSAGNPNQSRLAPLFIPRTCTISHYAYETSTSYTAATAYQVLLCQDASSGYPGPVAEVTSAATATGGSQTIVVASPTSGGKQITAGLLLDRAGSAVHH